MATGQRSTFDGRARPHADTRRESDASSALPRKKLPIIKKAIRIYNSTPQTDQADVGWSLGEMVMDERMKSRKRNWSNTTI